ncbi:MAG: DUF4926 domain-containing protein [Christensenellales bacterium]|jgi:hypothetical protein
MLYEHAVVVAINDLSDEVKRGCVGTIVMIYNDPSLAYEVEFFDDQYVTLGVLTVKPEDIAKRD